MSQNQLVTVEFHGQTIPAVLHDGKPHVALRPIVENIGLDWAAQYTRINRHPVLKSTVVVMTTVAEDGKQREMLCLPLTMLNGWLFGVDVNRVKPELRPKLMVYQRECFDVLFQHFMPKPTEGRPYNPAIDYDRISPAQAQDIKELVHMVVDAGVQGFGETWGRLHKKFRVNGYLELPAAKYDEACMYLRAKLPKRIEQQPLDLPDDSIDVAALLLSGQCSPKPLTAAQHALIDQAAGRLVGEAYPLIRAHLERRVAFDTNAAQQNDVEVTRGVLDSATLGNCLAHHYRTELKGAQMLMQTIRLHMDAALGSISQPFGLAH